jgi:ATP-dependent DNA helicase RecG
LHKLPIRYVKGVGPQRETRLAQLGIATVEDVCYYPPRRYEDRTRLAAIGTLSNREMVTVQGRLLAKSLRRTRNGKTLVEAAVGDASGILEVRWFNQPYLAQQLKVGDALILYGTVEPGARPQMIHPELERLEAEDARAASSAESGKPVTAGQGTSGQGTSDQGAGGQRAATTVSGSSGEPPMDRLAGSLQMGRIVPVYPLAGGLTQRWFRQVIATVLPPASVRLEEVLPEPLRRAHGWPGIVQAIPALHFPASWEEVEQARTRLAFEELFVLQVALAQRRARTVRMRKPQRYQLDGELTQGLRRRLPFALTASQERVLSELLQDLGQPFPMQRLLQGEVGCGKTILLAFLIAMAAQSGYQAALMAPTELLAEQHARLLRQVLEPLGVAVGLLTQGLPPAARRRCGEALASGKLSVIVGTHALIQAPTAFRRLALVIIDEQHKFGVLQRAHLARKAHAPDVLVVTATPIPRTMALSIYGDLDVSTVTELPPGRQPVTTRWLSEMERPTLYAMIRREMAQGRQGYIVYPLVEQAPAGALRAATQMARHLATEVLPDVRMGLLHGQMPSRQKDATMQAFAGGTLRLLVSTVIVEVGLDVPNATVMAIEHPERFGLAQLHQLRGRIGRGPHPATCLLIGDVADATARERLSRFVQTTDGFELAELDLEQRGPGELLGRRQHGWLRLRIASLSRRDRDLLELARREARTLVARDPDLRDPQVAVLRRRLARLRQPTG